MKGNDYYIIITYREISSTNNKAPVFFGLGAKQISVSPHTDDGGAHVINNFEFPCSSLKI